MIILNETKAVQELLNNNTANNPKMVINLLSRYYINNEKLTSQDTLKKIDNFLRSNCKKYIYSKWVDYIKKQIKLAKKFPLSEIDYIPITQMELDTIAQLNDIRLERITFVLLCYAKMYNLKTNKNNNWVNQELKTIFKNARVTVKIVDQCSMINKIKTSGLITYSKKVDNTNVKVNFIDNDTDSIMLRITDFRELGYEYLVWKGEKFFRCLECGILTRQNKQGNRKYCNLCSKYKPIETKFIICIDCGCEVKVDALDNQTNRCEECYDKYRKKYKAKKEKNRRNRLKLKNVDSTL